MISSLHNEPSTHNFKVLNADNSQLLKISKELGIGLNIDEMRAVKNYFTKLQRNPTDIELQVIGQTWSEHCFHKTFKGDVITEDGRIQNLFKTYIAQATEKLNPKWCISVFEDNAGIIEFDDGYAIAAKVETHNHPSAIEPFGGAATGIGGVIRDVLGVWADPLACTNVLGFGPLNFDEMKLPRGIKHPKYLFRGVIQGIGFYGNNMGIPTVNGAIYFDESYVGNVIVYCGCIGLLPINKFTRNAKAGHLILLVGGKTGLDGIHGVTFASIELDEKSEEIARPAVQIANPIEEEKLKRALLKVRDKEQASSITDLGGGGLSSAVGEMAHRFNCGAIVELEKVPLKYEGLAPWEIYVSESQERMLLLVPKENLEETVKIFNGEDVEATVIGKLTEDKCLRIYYNDCEVANLGINFLFSPPRVERAVKWKEVNQKEPSFQEPKHLDRYIFKLLSSPNITSREGVIRTYDHEVKGNTVLKPLQGEIGGPNDAAVIKPLQRSWRGIVISSGMNPRYGKIDPYWMAASAIDESIRNNVAVGGRRIALLDNFIWGNPEIADRLGSLVRACQACYEFAIAFEVPYISGKDSLYNESQLGPVTPTLLMTAIGILPDIRNTVSLDLKSPGNQIYVVGETFVELGGSEYYKLNGYLGRSIPKVRTPTARHIMNVITEAIDNRLVKACHDISEGGLAVASSEMAFSGNCGLEIKLGAVPRADDVCRDDFLLFSESNSRFLVEVPKERCWQFESIISEVPHACIGRVLDEHVLRFKGLNQSCILEADLEDLLTSWKIGLGV